MNAIKCESAHPVAPPGVSDSPPDNTPFGCPQCSTHQALVRAAGGYRCENCGTHYPVMRCDEREVPWLFAEPESAVAQWQDRHLRLQMELDAEVERLRRQLGGTPGAATRRRPQHLLSAKQQFRGQVQALLQPFWDEANVQDQEERIRLPHNQTIASYQANLFRDWVWGKMEVEAAYSALTRVLADARVDALGRLLTLGAGPGALPYLLEQRMPLVRSVKFDINPLFAAVNSAMMAGRCVPFVEFPTAPLNGACCAVLHTCDVNNMAARVCDTPSGYVLGDIKHMPFVDASFDTVFTPWLIDLLPARLDAFLADLNRLLPVGGYWLNTGSLNFSSHDALQNLDREELLERMAYFGFALKAQDLSRQPYLQSPSSGHHRMEQVFSFCAVKTHEVDLPEQPGSEPGGQPLQASLDTQFTASNHLLRAQVLGAINGQRSIDDIARAIGRKYDLVPAAARRVVTGIVEQEYKSPG